MKPITIALLAGAGLLLLTGCEEEKYSLKFSHYIHVTDNEMDCDECHGELGTPSFKVLSHESCTDCHDAHSLGLKVQGNLLCLHCHEAQRYDTVDHHHHPVQRPVCHDWLEAVEVHGAVRLGKPFGYRVASLDFERPRWVLYPDRVRHHPNHLSIPLSEIVLHVATSQLTGDTLIASSTYCVSVATSGNGLASIGNRST